MALKMGIIGLPNVGKSTLFNALTRSKGAQAANFPFCTIDPNVGIVEVPDERIAKIVEIVSPEKTIPAAVEFVDIAGLVKGASKGEGLGNKFLASIREVHALCHIVRFFEEDDITHVEGSVDPKRDRETINIELVLSDLQLMTNTIDKAKTAARTGDKDKQKRLAVCEKVAAVLETGEPASHADLSDDDMIIAADLHLLTLKPVIYAANVAEDQLGSLSVKDAHTKLQLSNSDELVLISAKIEEDLQDLSAEEAKEYLTDLGVTSSGLDTLIQAAYRALGYITFFTAGPKEVRAWTVKQGATAPQAAGAIHTDFEKGFIRAETIAYDDFVSLGGEQAAKDAGKLRSEGKDYIVKDGDVMHFRFNV